MRLFTFDDIKALNISPMEYYSWIDYVLNNRDSFELPTKTRLSLPGSDYCNIMPCAMPSKQIFGLKVITRSEQRRESGGLNMDSQILLYDYETANLNTVMDGNYITTIRTAAVAVHSIMNFVTDYNVISLVGLGNIGVAIGKLLFPFLKEKQINVKLYRYKDHAERFVRFFKHYDNIRFVICNTYDELMKDSDLVISSVTYADKDFCEPSIYKPGCTIIPVHMRGFMECDKEFDHIIVSDMERAKGFKYYSDFKKVSLTDDILEQKIPIRVKKEDRVLIYNLGLAITDLFFAYKIAQKLNNDDYIDLKPDKVFYM